MSRPARPAEPAAIVAAEDDTPTRQPRQVRLVAAEDDDATMELPVVRRQGDDLTPSQPPPPSRSLQRAVSTDDLRGTGTGTGEAPRRVPVRFRDDLAAPAAPRNGAAPDEANANGDGTARRRRGAPLRAR